MKRTERRIISAGILSIDSGLLRLLTQVLLLLLIRTVFDALRLWLNLDGWKLVLCLQWNIRTMLIGAESCACGERPGLLRRSYFVRRLNRSLFSRMIQDLTIFHIVSSCCSRVTVVTAFIGGLTSLTDNVPSVAWINSLRIIWSRCVRVGSFGIDRLAVLGGRVPACANCFYSDIGISFYFIHVKWNNLEVSGILFTKLYISGVWGNFDMRLNSCSMATNHRFINFNWSQIAFTVCVTVTVRICEVLKDRGDAWLHLEDIF